MRLLTISPEEASFLTQEIKQKYEALSGEELVITSYLARYEELADLIKTKTACFDGVDIVSTGLLRKLLESGKRHDSTKINRQFIDACYLFISDCQSTRSEYNDTTGASIEHGTINGASKDRESANGTSIQHQPANRTPLAPQRADGSSLEDEPTIGSSPTSLTWPFKGEKINLSISKDKFILSALIFTALLTWALAANWQYLLLQVPTPAPKYLWWVAEYPDGTKVYNNFRRYRTEKEVIEHFLGHGLKEGTRTGDCNAIYWIDDNRVNVCYDNIDNIKKFEEQHGGKPEIRFDG